MSTSVVVSESASPSESQEQPNLSILLGELKGLLMGLQQAISDQSQVLQEVKTQTTEILSLAEVIEDQTEEALETVEEVQETLETAEESAEEESESLTAVEVEIPAAPPIMTQEEPAKPESKAVSILRKSLLG